MELNALDFVSKYKDLPGIYDPHWDFYCDNIIVEGVTHWMPIPELPEESNDKE